MIITILLIYIFWITSAIVESMKWLDKYEFEKFKFFDYHCLRFINSLSVFVICVVPLFFIVDASLINLLGHWLLANQVYERIQDRLVRGKWFIGTDTDFVIGSFKMKIRWQYTIVTIIIGAILIFI